MAAPHPDQTNNIDGAAVEKAYHEQLLEDLKEATLPDGDTDTLLLWEALSHCNELPDNDLVIAALQASKVVSEGKTSKAIKEEQDDGKVRVKFDASGKPVKHFTWSSEFQLHVDEGSSTFYVLASTKSEVPAEDEIREAETLEDDATTLLCFLDCRYRLPGDNRGVTRDPPNKPEVEFNFAEHRKIGESINLRWKDGSTSNGTRELELKNGVKLNYGEINGYGGDFFGSYNPICTGENLEQSCRFFRDAFWSLAESPTAKKEVEALRLNRQEEVDKIYQAAAEGKSTFDVYKSMVKDGKTYFLSKEDEDLQAISFYGAGKPSYLPLAQLNLDHFGPDAKLAYAAGHYCALQKAAEGELETAYAMNAFADHYLGDCFAAGHIRTPRRILHGNVPNFENAWKSMKSIIDNGVALPAVVIKNMIPDLCAMLMHNEDNHRGLRVRNGKGEEWDAQGDKMLFEPSNKENKERMLAAIQASADEVYEAFKTQKAKTPDQGYKPFDHTPVAVVTEKSHSALFEPYTIDKGSWWDVKAKYKQETYWAVKVRNDINNPWDFGRGEIGNSASLAIKFAQIRGSHTFKGY